jgi:Fe-S cluster assembly protein SufD
MEKTITKKDELLLLAQSGSKIHQPESLKDEIKHAIANQSIPTRKTELWKNTDINELLENEYSNPTYSKLEANDLSQLNLLSVNGYQLVFYNGFFQAHLSNTANNDECIFGPLSENKEGRIFNVHSGKTKIYNESFFAALSFSAPQDGAFLYVKPNKFIEKPFHVILINGSPEKSLLAQLYHFIYLEKGAQAHLIVSQASLHTGTFENNSCEIFVSENAHLEQSNFQDTAQKSFVINTQKIYQSDNTGYKQNTFSFGGNFIRNNSILDMDGENSDAKFNGLYIPKDKEHFDNYILIKHIQPQCTSNQNYKGIMDNQSTAVFLGKVNVARNAQKTNAYQSNRNLLLSKQAKVSSKPQLEIYADDVACSHGSTTGQLDAEAIFFMQSRGISRDNAIRLLLFAFASDILEDIQHDEIKAYVDKILHHRFDASK